MEWYGIYLSLLLVVWGVLLLFWPKLLRHEWPFISLKELNSPVDDVDRTFSKVIGVCCILGGLAIIAWMMIEYFMA